MHTWILKDKCVATYIAPIKQKMHLINIMNKKSKIIFYFNLTTFMAGGTSIDSLLSYRCC